MAGRYDDIDSDSYNKNITKLRDNNASKIGRYIIHTVKVGEDAHSIAKKYYGDEKKFYLIMESNVDLTSYFSIKEGLQIIIPEEIDE